MKERQRNVSNSVKIELHYFHMRLHVCVRVDYEPSELHVTILPVFHHQTTNN